MHEFSIATALADLVKQHQPPGTILRTIVVEAGPLQGIDPEAMQWAWRGVTDGTDYAGSTIEVRMLPWRMHCPKCGKDSTSDEMKSECECGASESHPVDSDQLRLVAMTVDEAEQAKA